MIQMHAKTTVAAMQIDDALLSTSHVELIGTSNWLLALF
jgi:hypothetical protein